ncbi:MAG: hypothetical protein WCG47_19500 [Dermatophilaceae bacterium]
MQVAQGNVEGVGKGLEHRDSLDWQDIPLNLADPALGPAHGAG